jgi:tetratricopeptide (TPR) repeat protein
MTNAASEGLTMWEAGLAILLTPFRWFGIWLANRHWVAFWLGLPTILFLLVFLIFLRLGATVPKTELAEMYKQLATDAVADSNEDSDFRWLQKVSQLTPDDHETMYKMAQSMLKQGDTALGVDLIKRLAPRNDSGYPQAHFWTALRMLDSKEPMSKADLDELRHHLTEASEERELEAEATACLGELAIREGNLQDAAKYFTEATKVNKYWSKMLIPTLLSMGKKDEAIAVAEEAREFFREVTQSDPDDVAARIEWSRYASAIGKFGEAEAALRDAQVRMPGERVDKALSMLFVSRYDQEFPATATGDNALSQADFEEGLGYLEEALRLDPDNAAALSRLPALAELSPDLRSEVKKSLQRALDKQQATSIVHFGIGVIESLEGNPDAAKLHFELASAQGLQTAQLMNNLAWSIAYSEMPPLETALDLANKALAMQPERPEILDTRGHIFAKMGRHIEAIADLEKAIPNLARPEASRKLLRECYEAVTGKATQPN